MLNSLRLGRNYELALSVYNNRPGRTPMLELVVKLQIMLSIAAERIANAMSARVANRRAAGYVEYLLIALGAIAIFYLVQRFFIPGLGNSFKGIVNKLKVT